MNWFDRLERRLGRFAVPQVTLGLIILQVLVYVAAQEKPEVAERMVMLPAKVLHGEWWRLLTFLIIPPFTNVVFAFFTWYFFYLMGTALEHNWGTFRYNIFLLVGYLATLAASFAGLRIWPDSPNPASTAFLEGSVFLAFAYLFPDFVIYLFFILPVKIKWLALITWLWYGYVALVGGWPDRLVALGSVCNFVLFFGKDIIQRMGQARRRMKAQVGSYRNQDRPFHRCTVCGITDKSHPRMEFRYCSECEGARGYCSEHIRNHEHVVAAGEERTR